MRTEFYEQGMVGNRMLMEKSALPRKVKVTSLLQIVLRRYTNQIGGGRQDLVNKPLTKLMHKMKLNGYNVHQRMGILTNEGRRK